MDFKQKCGERGFRCSREDGVEGGQLVGKETRGSHCGPQERTQVGTMESSGSGSLTESGDGSGGELG